MTKSVSIEAIEKLLEGQVTYWGEKAKNLGRYKGDLHRKINTPGITQAWEDGAKNGEVIGNLRQLENLNRWVTHQKNKMILAESGNGILIVEENEESHRKAFITDIKEDQGFKMYRELVWYEGDYHYTLTLIGEIESEDSSIELIIEKTDEVAFGRVKYLGALSFEELVIKVKEGNSSSSGYPGILGVTVKESGSSPIGYPKVSDNWVWKPY